MKTIVEVIESRVNSQNSNCLFTYLVDGEFPQAPTTLYKIREDALKVGHFLPKQTPILLLLPQGITFLKAFIGCLYAQSVAVTSVIPSKNRGLDKLKSIVADANISYCLTNRDILNNLHKWFSNDELFSQLRWLLIEDIEQHRDDFSKLIELPKPEQAAFLQYTSGSVGKPKGVIVTHENIMANSKILQTFFQNTAESASVCWLPSFHDMGLIDGVIQPIYSDFHCVMMSPTHFIQKPVRWLKAMTDYKATYSGGPNFAYDLCVSRIKDEELANIDLSSLHCLYNASEPIRHQSMQKFLDRFSKVGFSEKHLFTCYGLAEATLAATASKLGSKPTVVKVDQNKFRQHRILITGKEPSIELVASGYTYCDTSLRIINPNTLEECSNSEIGEIWVSGKSITPGYLNAPKITAETFIIYNDTRFLRTGDLGFLLNGELFVTGRIKDLIIIRGTNHYPQDIEQTVYSSDPALEENGSAAFSVEIDREEKLVILQELKRMFRYNVDYASIFYKIMGEISKKHGVVPHDVVLIPPNILPKTSSGKIQRSACRKLWQSQQLSPLAALRENLFYEEIL